MPAFADKATTVEMPKANEASAKRRADYQSKAERIKEKARQWREAMEAPAYREAMEIIANEAGADLPPIEGKSTFLSEEAIEKLREIPDG